MSDEQNNLGDKAEKAFDDAKQKAKEVYEDVKEEAKDFAEDAQKTLGDGKTVAIIAHITIIGWIIAFVLNSQNKTDFGSFYVRQTLGIFILCLFYVIPLIGWIVALFGFILWIVSIINALGNNTNPVFVLGEKFQEWFKSI